MRTATRSSRAIDQTVSRTLELARTLIRAPSITPDDAGCQDFIASQLEPLGFDVEHLRRGEVDNLWARKGHTEPLFVFAGHTDVVPPGPSGAWHSDPFAPEVRDGNLYGRGAADMKGSLAAMITACERFLGRHADHHGSIGLLITSDEEGPAADGTVRVLEYLDSTATRIRWCLIGEPSSHQRLGDTIKNGRRGSLHGRLKFLGVQGHVAYPDLATNPIHGIGGLIALLTDQTWDQGSRFFPPTSFQISNIWSGTGATNVIPGELELMFNFRFGTESPAIALMRRVEELIEHHVQEQEQRYDQKYPHELDWHLSGEPFLTRGGELIEAACDAVHGILGYRPELSTSGGTSDGRFIAPTGAQVVELGPVNASIHKVNEHVRVQDLDRLSEIYCGVLERLLT